MALKDSSMSASMELFRAANFDNIHTTPLKSGRCFETAKPKGHLTILIEYCQIIHTIPLLKKREVFGDCFKAVRASELELAVSGIGPAGKEESFIKNLNN